MPISPHKDETQSEFMSRCVPEMIGTGEDKRPQAQAVAACLQIWRDKSKAVKQPDPDPDESREEFMSRCMNEIDDEAECELAWENRAVRVMMQRGVMHKIVQKTHVGQIDGAEYVLSDETLDRMGDIIKSDGWRLDNFKRNPIALFNHRSDFVVGKWRNLRVEDGELRAHLQLAPEGTSSRIDEIRKLVEAGILKAVSVGFKALKHEPLDKDAGPFSGIRFLEQELVETSLVSVGANPNALAIAKSLDISDAILDLVFAKHGRGSEIAAISRGSTGKHADMPQNRRSRAMTPSQRIKQIDGELTFLRDSLQQHFDNLDDTDVSDDELKKGKELTDKIGIKTKEREHFAEMERALGLQTAADNEPAHETRMPTRYVPKPNGGDGLPRVYPEVAQKDRPGDNWWRALTCLVKMQGERYLKKPHIEVIRDTYGENEKVRAVFEGIVGKAATLPAVTTPAQTGWAPELVRTEYAAWMESLQPQAVAMRLLSRGQQFTFGQNGIISIPSRLATPTIAGSFVGEALPIPVRQGAFTAITLVPKKLAVITVFSREISEHSTPAIEGLLRTAIVEDTAVALDAVLLDATAASAIRPAGLRNGVSTLTPTAGGGFAAVIGDIKLLVNALVTSTLGNIRNPVFLMSPALRLGLRLTVAPNGTFAFPEVEGGTLLGIPIIESSNVTTDTLYLIDAADLVSASGPPNFSVSDSATVHMEDTTPLAIGTAGTPATVAAPTRSFWQTDTLGIRMTMQMNWALRRTGMVQYITGTTWD